MNRSLAGQRFGWPIDPAVWVISAALSVSTTCQSQQLLNLQSLDGSNGFVIQGSETFDGLGTALSSAGDMNGDGIDDVIIGNDGDRPGSVDEGRSYIVYGSDQPRPAVFSVSALNAMNGFVLNGVFNADRSGSSVSAAGDVNGDGLDDVIIGAYLADVSGSEEGQSYVVFGSDQAIAAARDLSTLDGTNGFALSGIDADDFSGRSVSGAGDVNGDGFDDVIIGAERADIGSALSAGESYVVFGSALGFPANLDLSTLNGSNGFVLSGIEMGDESGSVVSTAGDINGDGFDDLVVGAPSASPENRVRGGSTYVVFGFDNSSVAELSLAGLDGSNGFTINGIEEFGRLGSAASFAGDVNSDGIDDLMIGAPTADGGLGIERGAIYLVFGSNQGFGSTVDLTTLDGSNGFVINGIDDGDEAGSAVSGAGDVNGDGIDDVIVGASRANRNGDSSVGESYLIFGRTQGFPPSVNLSDVNGRNGLTIAGIDPLDLSGAAVSAAGDVNADGIDDVIIGAPNADIVDSEGESYVVFGNAAPLALSGQALLPSSLEDVFTSSGGRVDISTAPHYLDQDVIGGLAIVNNPSNAAQGAWHYRTPSADWEAVPSGLSNSSALVVNATSSLRFVPAPDFAGQPDPLAARLWDGRWRQPGAGVNIINAISALGGFANDDNLLDITVNIIPVNDAPGFAAAQPSAVNEDPGGVTISGWATFDPGPADEAAQFALAYQVAAISNPGLFSILPTIDTLGNLVFNPAPDVSGTSTFDVRVVDSGGMANGGVNVSGFQTFVITVNPVNDPPTFFAEDPPSVTVDAGSQSVPAWASFDPGAPNESSQTGSYEVIDITNPTLFELAPYVDDAGNLSYTLATGASGVSVFTVQVRDDGGTDRGGQNTSLPQAFTLKVAGEGLFSDSFEGL